LIGGNEIIQKLTTNSKTVIFLQHAGWVKLLRRTAPVHGPRRNQPRRMARMRVGTVWLMKAVFFGLPMGDYCAEAL